MRSAELVEGSSIRSGVCSSASSASSSPSRASPTESTASERKRNGDGDGGAPPHAVRRPRPRRSITTLTTADASSPILLVAATDAELGGHDGLVCGVGPVEAAAATARALALRPYAAVLHVGLAGARGVAPGSLVIGTEAVYCDLSAEWPVVDRVTPDERLVEALRAALPDATTLPVHTSAAVAGAPGVSPPTALVEAMEGFGVLRAAELAGVPAVEVRAISNVIGEADRSRWDIAGAIAALERALPTMVDAVRRAVAS